ncbi:hypothetical protein D3C75_599680 [compost metagenome]
MRQRCVAAMPVSQRIEAGSLAFTLAPVAIAQQNAYLLGQVVGQCAIETPGAKLPGHLGQVRQRTGRRLLQVTHAGDADHRRDAHRWRGKAQKIEAVAQGFAHIVDAVHFVVRLGDRHGAGTGTDRATTVLVFGQKQDINEVPRGFQDIPAQQNAMGGGGNDHQCQFVMAGAQRFAFGAVEVLPSLLLLAEVDQTIDVQANAHSFIERVAEGSLA